MHVRCSAKKSAIPYRYAFSSWWCCTETVTTDEECFKSDSALGSSMSSSTSGPDIATSVHTISGIRKPSLDQFQPFGTVPNDVYLVGHGVKRKANRPLYARVVFAEDYIRPDSTTVWLQATACSTLGS
jgi:hypothetical protein